MLVVEYGGLEPGVDPYDFNTSPHPVPDRMRYNITSVGTKQVQLLIGCAVGGSSAVNQMLFMRGPSDDYDRWESAGEHGTKWNWNTLLPYFKKVSIVLKNI